MTNFDRVYPKNTFFIVCVFSVSTVAYFFDVRWYQIITTLAIDTLAFLAIHPIEKRIFLLVFPRFRQLKTAAEEAQTFEAQQERYRLMSELPRLRCLYLLGVSYLKVLPAGIYLALVAQNGIGPGPSLLLFYFLDTFVLLYFHGLLYIELHSLFSEEMVRLLKVETWRSHYRDLRLEYHADEMSWVQNGLLLVMLLNLFVLLMAPLTIGKPYGYVLFLPFSAAIFSLLNIQLKFQRYTVTSLKKSFEVFQNSFHAGELEVLALNTSPLLASFEHTFNQMTAKLKDREKEISYWLKREAENFHLRTLGEITALVAHDIKTPLHIMQVSHDMINDPTTPPETVKKYTEILGRNLEQTISFTETLMAFLKGSASRKEVRFGEVHHHLVELLRTQFSSSDFERIEFLLERETENCLLRISRLDAMHVFYNLYYNSVRSVLENPNQLQRIGVSSQAHGDNVSIFVRDSGIGLDSRVFAEMVSLNRFDSNESFQKSLGLRLTNSLLKYLGGALGFVPVEAGACIEVRIPGAVQNQGLESFQ